MLNVKKLVNVHGDEIFYVATEVGAIEISIRNGCDIYWNFIGLKYDRYSRDEVTLKISQEENEQIYFIFDKLYDEINDLDIKIKSGTLSNCYMGDDVLEVFDNEEIVWQSDDILASSANSLIITKDVDCYYVTFKKSQNLDGYLNRSFRVKIKSVGCRNAPLNMAFMDFYKDLLKMNDIDKKDQSAYTLRKKYETSLVAH